MGEIKKSFQGSRDRIVVHIQDAHVNEDAQKNIAQILDFFSKQYGMKLVNLEGAEGRLYPEVFSFFPDKSARQDVADYFLKQGRLSGPMYWAVVERPEAELFGIEDNALYEENRKAYLSATGNKERDEEILEKLGKILSEISRYVFSEDLQKLVKQRGSFQEGGHELIGYVRFLGEMSEKYHLAMHEYTGMNALGALVSLEKEIDFEKAEKEVEGLTQDLKRIIFKEHLSRFLTNTVQFRMKKMKRSAYYGYLEEELGNVPAGERDLKAKYANVLKYLKYMQLYDKIDVAIFDEIEQLEKGIKDKLFRSEEEVKLDRLLKIFEVYEKMFDFQLTKQDADFFYNYREEFKAKTFHDFLEPLLTRNKFSGQLPENLDLLNQDLVVVEKFYQAALSRDRILIDRTMDRMEKRGEKVAAVVTGGFHTPGIEKYLKEHDISYLVIAPKISKAIDEAKEGQIYENALSQKPTPVEKMLSEALLPPKSPVLNDPRFQLSVKQGPNLAEMRAWSAEMIEAAKVPDGRFYRMVFSPKQVTPQFLLTLLASAFKEGPQDAADDALRGIQAPGMQERLAKTHFQEAVIAILPMIRSAVPGKMTSGGAMTLILPSVKGTDGLPVSPVIARWTDRRGIAEVRIAFGSRQHFFAAEGIGGHSFAARMVSSLSEKIPSLRQAVTGFRPEKILKPEPAPARPVVEPAPQKPLPVAIKRIPKSIPTVQTRRLDRPVAFPGLPSGNGAPLASKREMEMSRRSEVRELQKESPQAKPGPERIGWKRIGLQFSTAGFFILMTPYAV
ncbi:MAG TPA: hypothetical protein VJC08_02785, partial [bacterium]|nr:hypothetical protein [bacterium]